LNGQLDDDIAKLKSIHDYINTFIYLNQKRVRITEAGENEIPEFRLIKEYIAAWLLLAENNI
jgi:hypothetical protein